MCNITTIKQRLLTIAIFGLLTTLITSCGSDNLGTTSLEKITFPTIEFSISATSDTTVFGPQGTHFFIEKETFQFPDGTPVTDSIKISLKEFYKKSDIVLADYLTEYNGRFIENGGMIYVTASSKGQVIEIKEDKIIVVHFPKSQDKDKEMDLSYADQNANDTSFTNWMVKTPDLEKLVAKLGSWGYEWVSEDDSTEFLLVPKNGVDTADFLNHIHISNFISTYNFSKTTLKAISQCNDGLGVRTEFIIDKNGKIKNPEICSAISNVAAKEILQFLRQLPDFKPGKNNKGEIIERLGLVTINTETVRIQSTDAEYLRSFDSKYSKYKNKAIKNINDAELKYHVFSVPKLGWINCYRFLESKMTTDYIVKTQEKDTKIKMVFKDINGVLIANSKDGKFVFSNVPLGRQVTIVGIKNINGQFHTAFQETTISDKPLETLVFKETTLTEFKQLLEKLN